MLLNRYLDERKHPPVDMSAQTPDEIVEQEREKCAAIRRHLGPDIKLMFDAHQGNPQPGCTPPWSVDTAMQVLAAVEPFDIFFYEEPLPYENVEGYAQLMLKRYQKKLLGPFGPNAFFALDRPREFH